MYVVWNDLTQATDFEGTKEECNRFLKDYPGFPGWIQVAPDVEETGVVNTRVVTPAEDLKIQERTLKGLEKNLKEMEATLDLVRKGTIPPNLKAPYQQREFVTKLTETQNAVIRVREKVVSLKKYVKPSFFS